MTRFTVPYICPECDHDRWVDADPNDPASKQLKCPECGHEDTLKL